MLMLCISNTTVGRVGSVLVVSLASQVPMVPPLVVVDVKGKYLMAEKNSVVSPSFCSEQIGLFIGNKLTDEFNPRLQ